MWRPSPIAALLVAANAGVSVAQQSIGPNGAIWCVRFGLLPRALWEGEGDGVAGAIQPYVPVLLTAGLLHAGVGYRAIKRAYLSLLGPNVERAIGWWRFRAVWLAATVAGGGTHAAVHPQSLVPASGASAGVSGLIGLVTLGGKAGLLIGAIGLGVQAAGVLTQIEDVFGPAVAWGVHLGGFGVGLAAGALFGSAPSGAERARLRGAGDGRPVGAEILRTGPAAAADAPEWAGAVRCGEAVAAAATAGPPAKGS